MQSFEGKVQLVRDRIILVSKQYSTLPMSILIEARCVCDFTSDVSSECCFVSSFIGDCSDG